MLNRIDRLQTTGNRLPRLGRTLLKAFGLLCLFAGGFSLFNEYRSDQQSSHVTGTIFDVREGIEGSSKYLPVVEFTAHDGRVIHFQGAPTRVKPAKGTPVAVLYDPAKPEAARIDSFVQRWLFGCVFTPIGVLFIATAVRWRHA